MTEKTKSLLALMGNLIVVVLELISLPSVFLDSGLKMIQYYTEDSNLFALVACLILAVCQGAALARKREVPRWAMLLKYMCVCYLTVTFLVVLLILAPTYDGGHGYRALLFQGTMLYQHFLCPVLAFLSFVLFEHEPALPQKAAKLAMLPTLIYAVIVIFLNLMRVMVGPYPFLHVYEQPVFMSILWFVVILGGAYAIAWTILWLHRRLRIGERT